MSVTMLPLSIFKVHQPKRDIPVNSSFAFRVYVCVNTNGRGRTGSHVNLGLHWPP